MIDIVSPQLVHVRGRAYRILSSGSAPPPSRAYRRGDDEDVVEEELYEAEQATGSSARAPVFDDGTDQAQEPGTRCHGPVAADEEDEDLDESQVVADPKGSGFYSVVSCDPTVSRHPMHGTNAATPHIVAQ